MDTLVVPLCQFMMSFISFKTISIMCLFAMSKVLPMPPRALLEFPVKWESVWQPLALEQPT